MIQFSNENTASLVRSMWKICFGDTDEYMNLYFSKKYKHENTLIYFENDVAVASLQMLPYQIRFYGEIVPFYYLAGLCTLPEFRNKGYMGHLIKKSYEVMQDRSIPLCILVPAEDWLFNYYAKYGFETTFVEGGRSIDIKSIVDGNSNNLETAYQDFDFKYQQQDFCVLKNIDDFKTIVQENNNENYPVKYNLSAMSAVIDAEILLGIYASKHKQNKFKIKVNDTLQHRHIIYHIKEGFVEKCNTNNFDIEVSSQMLARLLFGFKTDLLDPQLYSLFEKHNPIINLMLE